MDSELHHHHPVIRRIYLYIFIVTFLLFFGFVVIYFSQVQAPTKPEEVATEEQTTKNLPTENKGSLSLSLQGGQEEVSVGQTFNLVVAAASGESEIVGFDILLSYDQKAFTAGNATTPLQSYQVFSSAGNDYQSFTGALSATGSPVSFAETDIMTVPFTAKQKGKYTFKILPSAGEETTKLVESETTKVFTPQVADLQVTVN